jgi:uroporphyrinogen-III synthase
MRLLVTRPEPEARRTATLLRSHGHDVIVAPLLRVEPVHAVAFGPGPWAALAFTSANAVRAIATHARFPALAALPAFTVGSRTRETAVSAGFSAVTSAEGDVDDLARLIAGEAGDGSLPILYFAGTERAGDLAGTLAEAGRSVETVIAYRVAIVSDFDAEIRARAMAGGIDGVLHYSPRSASAFLTAAAEAGLRDFARSVKHFCLSPAVAAPLIAAGAGTVNVAAAPAEGALLALIDRP